MTSVCHLKGQIKSHDDSITYKMRHNAFYYEIGGQLLASLNYSHLFSITEKNSIAISSGFCSSKILDGYLIPCEENFLFFIEGTYLRGGPKRFLEMGYSYEFTEPMHQPRLGYRYQGEKGFIFRCAFMILTKSSKKFYAKDGSLFMGFSVGYCF